ncbi:ABC transporter permease [Afipia sp. P52-10]|jgi:NitT/TauT family transport system permease protein|uniref:ABC transporter permease n=1 Tax=Afipia sp. P52-10 TaxID=1429916 RepID=UPI0004AC669B|nr:ABC transporter permease [Afipia sp. P52-10]
MNDQRRLSGPMIWVARIVFLAAFFALWEWVADAKLIDPILIGKPSGIAQYLWDELFVTRSLLSDFYWSMGGTVLAFLLGSVAGILVGMLFVTSPSTEAVFNPMLTALNAMPRIALAPLFIIWFGLGLGSKVAVGFSLTFFIVLTSTVAGGRGVNPDHVTLARTLGASESQIFRKFVLPSAVPVIFNGLRLGLVFALLGVIGAEILASEHGLGQTLSVLAASFKTNGVFGIIFLLSLIGVAISWGMTSLENRLLRWR